MIARDVTPQPRSVPVPLGPLPLLLVVAAALVFIGGPVIRWIFDQTDARHINVHQQRTLVQKVEEQRVLGAELQRAEDEIERLTRLLDAAGVPHEN